MTKAEQYAKNVELLTSRLDFSPVVKMKNALNEVFGEEYNQIINPFTKPGFVRYAEVNDFSLQYDAYFTEMLRKAEAWFEIVIHIPKVTVTNSKKKSIEVNDLYLRFQMNLEFKIMDPLQGVVATFNKDLYRAGYQHSHLPSGIYTRFAYFCLGSDTPLAINFHRMRSDAFDEGKFKMLLYLIKEYVKWESLEGGPHYRMEGIVNQSSSVHYMEKHYTYDEIMQGGYSNVFMPWDSSQSLGKYCVNILLDKAKTEEGLSKVMDQYFTYKLEGTEARLFPTDDLSKDLAEHFLSLFNSIVTGTAVLRRIGTQTLLHKKLLDINANLDGVNIPELYTNFLDLPYRIIYRMDSAKKYFVDPELYRRAVGSNMPTHGNIGNPPTQEILKFKDRSVRIQILADPEEPTTSTEDSPFHIHPKIINYVTSHFTTKINYSILTSCTGTGDDTNDNFAEAPTPDILALLED